MTRDEILTTVLGERSGFVRGKGYGAKPPSKRGISQAEVDARVSSALENVRDQMQAELERKMQVELDRKLQEMQAQMATFMASIQQVYHSTNVKI